MRILILGNHEVVIYNFRKELILELISRGHEVTVSFPEGERTQYFKDIGCSFENLEVERHSTNPMHDLKLLADYVRLIKRINPDIVLTYTIKPNIWGGVASLLTRKPYIANITGLGTALERSGVTQQITKVLYRVAMTSVHRIFFQNRSNLEFFERSQIGRKRHRLLPGSGVNLKEFAPTAYPAVVDQAIRFLFIGRIKKEKGIEEYLEVASKITREFPTVEFGILGFFDGDYSAQIEECVSNGVITYYGNTQDVRPHILKSHAIVLPSYSEGMANVLLEAAAMSRPVIASDIPGCAETFRDNVSGISFQPQSSDALEKAVRKFLSLSHLEKENMGVEGTTWVSQKFSRQIVVDKYLREIESFRAA